MKYELDQFGGWTPVRVGAYDPRPLAELQREYLPLLYCRCGHPQMDVEVDCAGYTIHCRGCYSGPPDFVATQPTLWDATEEWNEHIEEGRA